MRFSFFFPKNAKIRPTKNSIEIKVSAVVISRANYNSWYSYFLSFAHGFLVKHSYSNPNLSLTQVGGGKGRVKIDAIIYFINTWTWLKYRYTRFVFCSSILLTRKSSWVYILCNLVPRVSPFPVPQRPWNEVTFHAVFFRIFPLLCFWLWVYF